MIFSLGLICFRAENLREVFAVLQAGVTHISQRGFSHIKGEMGYCNLGMLCIAFVVFVAVEILQNRGVDVFTWITGKKSVVSWAAYLFICVMILLSLGTAGQSFIYAGF